MVFLKDIKQILINGGVSLPIFCGNRPAAPTTCITLYEYSGLSPEYDYTTTPGLQLMLRVAPEEYESGYEQLETAEGILLNIGSETSETDGVEINGNLYLRIYTPNSGFNPLGDDENGNPLISKNFYVIRRVNNGQ